MPHPSRVAIKHTIDNSTIIVVHGEEGYYPYPGDESPAEINANIERWENVKIDDNVLQAYELGSLFGWHIPAVANYV